MITSEADCFPALSQKFEFVSLEKPDVMIVRKHWNENGLHCSQLGLLRVHSVDIEVLKRYDIWPKLSTETQKSIENMTMAEKEAVNNLLEKARAGRKQKYPNVPRELECITCHKKVSIPPSVLVARVEKIAKTKGSTYIMDDYIKVFQCTKCVPVARGRKANPLYAHLPKELVCKCGKRVSTNSTALAKAAGKKKITIEKYIESYRCQSCFPTRGKHSRKRK